MRLKQTVHIAICAAKRAQTWGKTTSRIGELGAGLGLFFCFSIDPFAVGVISLRTHRTL